MSSQITFPAGRSSTSASAPPTDAAYSTQDQLGEELARLIQRTARSAQVTLTQMGVQAQGSGHDLLDAVRLLSRLKEQCEEALATAHQLLPSEEDETDKIGNLLNAVQKADSVEAVIKALDELHKVEASLESTVGKSIRALAETRLAMFAQMQAQQPGELTQVMHWVGEMRMHQRVARSAVRALTGRVAPTGAIERIGLAGVARCIDADLDQALDVCQRHLDLLAVRETALEQGAEVHAEQIRRARVELRDLSHDLERAHAAQMETQGALLQMAGRVVEQLTAQSVAALEVIQHDALRTQCALRQLAFEPIAEAVRKANGLQGAYGSIRGALMGLADREQLVHLLENWLLEVAEKRVTPLFTQALGTEGWRIWSAQFDIMAVLDQPEWMAWTFEALGLPHPEVPHSVTTLQKVVGAYCIVRPLLMEMEPGYDPHGELLQKIKTVLDQEQAKWSAWARLGMTADRPADVHELLRLAQDSLPLPGLREAIRQWDARKAAQARAVSDRMQRLTLGDWRRNYTLHEQGTFEAWAQNWMRHYAELRDSQPLDWKNLRDQLLAKFSVDYPPVLMRLNTWMEQHGCGLERDLQQRALDLTVLGTPFLEVNFCTQHGTAEKVALRMPRQMEEVFTACLGPETLAYVRQAEVLGLGRLRFSPQMGLDVGNNAGLHWGNTSVIPENCIYSVEKMAQKYVEQAFLYLAYPLKWTWIDVAGKEHDIASFNWRDHGRGRRASIYAPTGFALQNHKDWWAHPAEKIRICQTALDGLNASVSNGDYFVVIESQASYRGGWEWPIDTEEKAKRFEASSKELLRRFQSLIGFAPHELAKRFAQAAPKDWSGEAADAQTRLLAYVQALAGTTEASGAVDLLDRLVVAAADACPDHQAIWRSLVDMARSAPLGNSTDGISASSHAGASTLPKFSMSEIEQLFEQMKHGLKMLELH